MELKGKTVLVTGAAKRIGRALATGFAERGAQLLVHYHTSEEEAASLVEELPEARAYRADLTQLSELKTVVQQIVADVGGVDVLIHNASLFFPTPLETTTEEQWDRLLAIHVKAGYFLAQGLAPTMRQRGAGRIIYLADWTGLHPKRDYVPYCTSKGALITMTQGLALELAPEILVNAVCPGPILPSPGMDAKAQTQVRERTLLKRWGSTANLVRTVLFLAEQDYATGSHYLMDGGESLV